MLTNLIDRIKAAFFSKEALPIEMSSEHRAFLQQAVGFYRDLTPQDQTRFEYRCLSFIYATEFIGHNLEVSEKDKLLVASGSVILAWGFERWHYVKVDTVILVDRAFSEDSLFDQEDSHITGLVGTHHLRGKMILSQAALHQGFSNTNDKRNVAIHEFAHLIDMADGEIDGLPKQIAEQSFTLPWLALIQNKIADINHKKSDIRDYGATNNAEFFAVACEYFFERPKLLKLKHPILYKALEGFYKQNRADVHASEHIRKKGPCPCGSGKRYKRCCSSA
ncbi:MAG: Mlc titration factor MtfA (ptsG expression regulator) [Arenicella sp.]|jgi:Mlc titration factor MtfA (ptsG expression regulator)